MELAKGIEAKLEGGKIKLEADLAVLFLDKVEAGIADGSIDLVKGTDLDKELLLKAVAYLKTLSL